MSTNEFWYQVYVSYTSWKTSWKTSNVRWNVDHGSKHDNLLNINDQSDATETCYIITINHFWGPFEKWIKSILISLRTSFAPLILATSIALSITWQIAPRRQEIALLLRHSAKARCSKQSHLISVMGLFCVTTFCSGRAFTSRCSLSWWRVFLSTSSPVLFISSRISSLSDAVPSRSSMTNLRSCFFVLFRCYISRAVQLSNAVSVTFVPKWRICVLSRHTGDKAFFIAKNAPSIQFLLEFINGDLSLKDKAEDTGLSWVWLGRERFVPDWDWRFTASPVDMCFGLIEGSSWTSMIISDGI